MLQLVGGSSPLLPEQIAVLGDAKLSEGNPFRSYGYRRLADYTAGLTDGKILGEVEPPEGRNVQSDPVQLKSGEINQGMSGAAVLDINEKRNLVVGIVSETWFPDNSTKDRDTAWAVNAKVLAFKPINLPVKDISYPLRSAPQPKTDNEVAKKALVTKLEYLFSWDEVPGKDNYLLIEYLIKNFDVGWVRTAQVKKSDDGRTISFSDAKNSLSLELNNEKMKAILTINDGRTDEFTVRMENGKLNIYKLVFALDKAPPPLEVWVGREDLMRSISTDWRASKHHVVGLIGFGGEGKSSLALQWLNNLLDDYKIKDPAQTKHLDGVFWWTFDEKRNVDEFLEAALHYMSGGNSALLSDNPSSAARADLTASMLRNSSSIFILDGLEVMQHQDGDQYGQMRSDILRDFLGYVAAKKETNSFCLITSRVPVLDLSEYTTYTYRNVDRLSPDEGRTLLQKLGVNGSDAELNKVVAEWNGHALTLNLLGTFLVKEHKGDITCISKIPPPTADGPYERINHLLRHYDEHLKDSERAFLAMFSAFRTPVKESAFEQVFRVKMGADAPNATITALDDLAFKAMLKHLVEYSLLRFDRLSNRYTTHPLIRTHYNKRLIEIGSTHAQAVHRCIKDYYLAVAGDLPSHPAGQTIDNLAPLIEAVYHSCRAGEYEGGYKIYLDKIDKKQGILLYQLGAYETDLALMLEFFPKGEEYLFIWDNIPGNDNEILIEFLNRHFGIGWVKTAKIEKIDDFGTIKLSTEKNFLLLRLNDEKTEVNLKIDDGRTDKFIAQVKNSKLNIYSEEPLINDPRDKAYLIRSLGLCLMTVGRLQQALSMYERSYKISHEVEDLFNAGKASQLLSELHIHLGNLTTSKNYADQARKHYRKSKDRWGKCCSLDHEMWGVQNAAMGIPQLTICCLGYKAWAMHLSGDRQGAGAMFKQAEESARRNNPKMRYLRDLWGIYHADHLLQIGDMEYAKQITDENLKYARDKHLTEIISQCHRVLGDIDAKSGLQSAKEHYDEALKIARNITHRAVLIEALLGRGRWNSRHGDIKDALSDLEEALSYASTAGYRIYEADIRMALACASGNTSESCLTAAVRAYQLSNDIGYYWVKEAAENLLKNFQRRS
ncbi:MAG: hypothetical protein OIN66_17555 [Candidatus Methanoperedens sp.]|nr:hypothetical protein [Candidatus Methanoperedens sp.]